MVSKGSPRGAKPFLDKFLPLPFREGDTGGGLPHKKLISGFPTPGGRLFKITPGDSKVFVFQ